MGEEGRLHLYAATPQGQHGHLSSTSEPHSSTGPWCRSPCLIQLHFLKAWLRA